MPVLRKRGDAADIICLALFDHLTVVRVCTERRFEAITALMILRLELRKTELLLALEAGSSDAHQGLTGAPSSLAKTSKRSCHGANAFMVGATYVMTRTACRGKDVALRAHSLLVAGRCDELARIVQLVIDLSCHRTSGRLSLIE